MAVVNAAYWVVGSIAESACSDGRQEVRVVNWVPRFRS